MIPRRAFFLWVGDDELPWLRRLSVDSFRKFNPDWDVDLVRVPARPGMGPQQATDIARYELLATTGGLYLDTDIIFFRAVPDSLLDCDVAVTIDKEPFKYERGSPTSSPNVEHMPGFTNLAFLGSGRSSEFFRHMHEKALARMRFLQDDNVDIQRLMYQAFGTELLNRQFIGMDEAQIADRFNMSICNVPLDVVLPVRWYETRKLFNGTTFDPPGETIGVHWYGGCVDAKQYCRRLTLDTFERRPCYLTDAIKVALA